MKENKNETGKKTGRKAVNLKTKNASKLSTENQIKQVKVPLDESLMILRERANTLATGQNKGLLHEETMEIIVFKLAAEYYAIETKFVREVYLLKDYTILPGIPAFILGVINVRGQIISVIDLKKFFGLPETGIGELNKVIIIQNDEMEFGILADNIQGTQLIPLSAIQTNLSNISDIGSDYLKGVTNEHFIILDAKKMLEDENIIVNQETK
ncbi:MAG: chemotaxis protein CheW [Bacteroidetes bacterium HGW-Bacteroidetes-17]|jgi:purine-binding chemotaxis protein CheW|nr:MAG: chemotaxis protein CheW [Bacteroidetes bacterium HGW-Bacteroidetes-17]